MEVRLVEEYRITNEWRNKLQELLVESFPIFPNDRIYYKQVPNFRLLITEDGVLLGQCGVVYRVIRLNDRPCKIFGVVDLCVKESAQGKGIATEILTHVEELGKESDAEFILLFADDARVYNANGYQKSNNVCRWLMIHEHRSIGLAQRPLNEELMIKPLRGRVWEEGSVDLMGEVF